MFEEHAVIKLKKDLPEERLKMGDRGTIVMVYPKISESQDYEVEFSDSDGFTISLLTLPESILEEAD
jgi:hypothetical protein